MQLCALPAIAATAPRNVVVVLTDGTRLPAECIFLGVSDDGLFVWEVANFIVQRQQVERLEIDLLPVRTTILLPFHQPSF